MVEFIATKALRHEIILNSKFLMLNYGTPTAWNFIVELRESGGIICADSEELQQKKNIKRLIL